MRPRTANKCEFNLNEVFLIELLWPRKQLIKLWENLSNLSRFWTEIKEILVGQELKKQKATSNECGRLLRKMQRNRTKPVLIVSDFEEWHQGPSYKIKIKQQLLEPDFAGRMTFCNWLLVHALHWHNCCDWQGCLQHEWTCEHTKHWSTHPPNENIFETSVHR